MIASNKIFEKIRDAKFDVTWRAGGEAWKFTDAQIATLHAIGAAALAFYRALEKLYLASAENKSLLRNEDLRAPWVAELLDRGKPARLIAHARSRALRGSAPSVVRPDLLITENGFALTELDSVPGGIGLTAFLEATYLGETKIPEHFFRTLGRKKIAVAVADEAAAYRPEFEFLAKSFPENIFVCHPNDLEIRAGGVFLAGTRIELVYRFFELFDLENVHAADTLMDAVERGEVVVSPPMRPFQEEKMSLAFLHHPALEKFWQESLGNTHFSQLKRIVPATWIIEPVGNLPACATLLAPMPIRDWRELARFSKRERGRLVLKASGFSPEAWGARSVTVGEDVSQGEWATAVENAIDSGERKSLYVLQEFCKPVRVEYKILDATGTPATAFGRARICPYYFAGTLAGTLATLCPADKKIIHGMPVATLLPCKLSMEAKLPASLKCR